jgi:multisubunit Na+/H+ antiporter MnhF subunit
MNPWLWATLGLIPALLAGLWRSGRDALPRRLVALELATSSSIATLLTLSFAFDQPSSTDLALTLAFLCLPGSLVFVLFTERWL